MTIAALATIARDRYAAMIAAAGVDSAVVQRWFASRSEGERIDPAFDDARGERVVAGLAEAGIPRARLDLHGALVGQYLATLIVLERLRLGLAIE
jgi:hypothetical protein